MKDYVLPLRVNNNSSNVANQTKEVFVTYRRILPDVIVYRVLSLAYELTHWSGCRVYTH